MKKTAVVDFMSNYGKYLPGLVLAGAVWHCSVIICEKLQPEDATKLAKSGANLMDQVALLLERVAKTQIEDHQETAEEQQNDDPSFL